MRVFENLEPKEVFYYFEDICIHRKSVIIA